MKNHFGIEMSTGARFSNGFFLLGSLKCNETQIWKSSPRMNRMMVSFISSY